jgi:Methylenetetrahydrofolate reductase
MHIDEILDAKRPVFSVEFFPPKTEEAKEQLFATARSLRELEPDFVSVTYGAGGSTRDGTVEITRALKDDLGLETMAHLSCVGETTEGLAETLDRIAAANRTSSSPRAASAAPPSWPGSSPARDAGTSRSAAPASPRCTPRRPTSTPTSTI